MVLIFELIIFILVIIFSTIFTAMYFYFTRNFKFWHKLGIPYVKPAPFVGNLKDCVFQKMSIGEKIQQIYKEHSDKPYVGIFSFDKPSLVIRDVELVKNVVVKDSQNFIDHVFSLNEKLDPLFSQILFAIRGRKWRHLRTNLTMVFTSGKMKKMFYLVDTCGKELADCLDRATGEGSNVDVVEIMYRYTTDTIASCAFGINGHSLEDPQSEFRHFLRKIFDFSIRKSIAGLMIFFAPELMPPLNLKFVDDEVNNYVRKIVWSTVEYREKNGIIRNDFLDFMMELRNKGKEEFAESIQSDMNTKIDTTMQIDGDLFVAQAFAFLVAGFETPGTTLSYAIYKIALHAEVQHRLRAEIVTVMKKYNGELTYNGVQEMSYLDMVVLETLRMYPVFPFLDRICVKDYELPDPTGNGTVTLPAGTAVYIPTFGLHHDPTYYPEPEKFDPERFTEENKQGRPNYTYLTFGEGPRMCIGMRFALMQVKTALCHILTRFEVAPCKDTPLHISFNPKDFELKPSTDITLSFKRINF